MTDKVIKCSTYIYIFWCKVLWHPLRSVCISDTAHFKIKTLFFITKTLMDMVSWVPSGLALTAQNWLFYNVGFKVSVWPSFMGNYCHMWSHTFITLPFQFHLCFLVTTGLLVSKSYLRISLITTTACSKTT